MTADPHHAPASEEQLDALVRAFENCVLPKPHWTHEAHLAVGAYYVFNFGEAKALEEMRRCVRAYNEAVGTANTATSGYHETLTRMWISALARLREQTLTAPRLAFIQLAVETFGPRRDLHTKLYSFNVVQDSNARAHWVEPDIMR